MSRRRSPGEGAAYRLDDGTWRGFVDLGWRDGRRRRKYVRGRTKADVLQKVRKLTAEAEAGRLSPDRAPTLGAWLDRYLTEVAATTVRPSTLHRYRQEVRLYIAPRSRQGPDLISCGQRRSRASTRIGSATTHLAASVGYTLCFGVP